MSMKEKKLVIVITTSNSMTTTEYIGDTTLLAQHAKQMAYDVVDGHFD